MIPENNGTFPETMLPAKSGALLKIEYISLPTLFPKTSFIANAFRKTTALSLCRLQKVSNIQIRADPFLVRRDNKYLCRVAVQPKAVPPFCVFRLFFSVLHTKSAVKGNAVLLGNIDNTRISIYCFLCPLLLSGACTTILSTKSLRISAVRSSGSVYLRTFFRNC